MRISPSCQLANILTALLQVTLAIGGWNEGSEKYSKMAANPRSRRTFAESALRFIQRHNFDGLGTTSVILTLMNLILLTQILIGSTLAKEVEALRTRKTSSCSSKI